MYGEMIPIGGGDPIPLLKKDLLVGRRESCDIRLRFANVSAHHCQLTCRNGYWYVQDLNSRNGTKVNGKRVTEKRIDPGDTVSVAKHNYEFHYSPAELALLALLRPNKTTPWPTSWVIRCSSAPAWTAASERRLPTATTSKRMKVGGSRIPTARCDLPCWHDTPARGARNLARNLRKTKKKIPGAGQAARHRRCGWQAAISGSSRCEHNSDTTAALAWQATRRSSVRPSSPPAWAEQRSARRSCARRASSPNVRPTSGPHFGA